MRPRWNCERLTWWNVTNEVSPTPVTVANTVNVPADAGSHKTVTYDGRGRVAEIIEEPL
jgi:hypothetical protein